MTTDIVQGMEGLSFDNVPYFSFGTEDIPARVLDVYDGDTVTVAIIHHGTPVKIRVRLAHIDTAEIKGKGAGTKAKATEAKAFVLSHIFGRYVSPSLTKKQLRELFASEPIIVTLSLLGFDKYGRSLGTIKTTKGDDLSSLLLGAGLALPYEGGKKEELLPQ